MKEDNSFGIVVLLVGISFVYGVIHALGPGHGKFIATSYFLSRKVSFSKGLIMGTLIAMFHAGSAIILVLLVYFILSGSYLSSLEDTSRIVGLVSFSLITLIGIYLVVSFIRDRRRIETPTERNGSNKKQENRSIFSVALAVGIVPCPGAVLILLFSFSMGIFAVGILLTVAMAAGMAVSISAVAGLAILARHGLARIMLANSRASRIVQSGLRLAGALIITFFGLFLLLGSLNIIS